MKTTESILFGKYKKTGEKERYALNHLFDYMNASQEDYTYIFTASSDSEKICYDGTLLIKYKMTGNFVGHYLIEAKIRTNNYQELILEKKKFNNLKKEKTQQDKRNIPQHHLGIMYVNFCLDGTYLFDLLTLEQNKLLPKTIKKSMNAITIASTDDKEEKLVYLLDRDELAIKKKYIFDENNYANDLIVDVSDKLTIINEIKSTTYSIF